VARTKTKAQTKAQTLALALLMPVAALAQTPAAQQQARQDELRAAGKAAQAAEMMGPRDIALGAEATLHLPAGLAFVPAAEANRYMVALGNSREDRRLGLVVSNRDGEDWLADVAWINEGHVPDADAKEWQPDAMLDSLREGTEAQNKDRLARGFPAFEIIGWIEPPTYDAKTHRLIWSLAGKDRGAADAAPRNVNYNTYVLGREGYIRLDMITDSAAIGRDKQTARTLLSDIQFAQTKRYEDYNPSTDRLAAYGIAALVGAVAIKKLGLLAVIGVFLLKAWKIGLIIALGGWAAIKRFFGRLFGRSEAVAAEESPEQSGAPPAAHDVPEETPPPSATDTAHRAEPE
jgi:uncharacterized membrane-anchored protein